MFNRKLYQTLMLLVLLGLLIAGYRSTLTSPIVKVEFEGNIAYQGDESLHMVNFTFEPNETNGVWEMSGSALQLPQDGKVAELYGLETLTRENGEVEKIWHKETNAYWGIMTRHGERTRLRTPSLLIDCTNTSCIISPHDIMRDSK